MKLKEYKCISDNVSLDDYYELYNDVRDNKEYPFWLGLIPREDTEDILKNGGKIWLYYDNEIPICSVFYIPVSNKTLRKYNIEVDESITGSLGPIMVRKEYIGNGLMKQMLEVYDNYNKEKGNKYSFSKVMVDNIYSHNNLMKNGYNIVCVYENERGKNNAYLKEI